MGNFGTYFQFPLMFLTKEFGTPYQVSAFPVGAPNRGWWPRWVAVWITFFCLLDILFCGSPFVCWLTICLFCLSEFLDHRHCRLVPVDVVPFAERVHDVQLDVGEGGERVEDEGGQVLHALDVLPHERDALPVVHHVLVQVRLYGSRICNKLSK